MAYKVFEDNSKKISSFYNYKLIYEDSEKKVFKDNFGIIYFTDKNNMVHREDGPAIIGLRDVSYYKKGKIHRDKFPANLGLKQFGFYKNDVFQFNMEFLKIDIFSKFDLKLIYEDTNKKVYKILHSFTLIFTDKYGNIYNDNGPSIILPYGDIYFLKKDDNIKNKRIRNINYRDKFIINEKVIRLNSL